MNVTVGFTDRAELSEVAVLDAQYGEGVFNEREIWRLIRGGRHIVVVARQCRRIVGYALYYISVCRVEFLSLVVAEDARWQGVGRKIVRFVEKQNRHLRRKMCFPVREYNLDGQLFLKNLGFHCRKIVRDFYQDRYQDRPTVKEDAYYFSRKLRKPAYDRVV